MGKIPESYLPPPELRPNATAWSGGNLPAGVAVRREVARRPGNQRLAHEMMARDVVARIEAVEIAPHVRQFLFAIGGQRLGRLRQRECQARHGGGQQQRLCIARALAINPDVLLLDEPCSALDPISTSKIEKLLVKLKDEKTIIIVTHNMQQASRVSDFTAFMYLGELIEFGTTRDIFESPKNPLTEKYITGEFG